MLGGLKRRLALLILAVGAGGAADKAYVAEIRKFRQESDEFLRSDKSPLRLVGRFKVEEGVSTVGSDPASTIVFLERTPKQIGTLPGTVEHSVSNLPLEPRWPSTDRR